MTTSRGITDTRVYDREGVIERYGVPPERVPDFIGLKGDTSDNIPGVPGIGDKTAAQLLQQYGTLEEVLSHIDEISGKKRQENLRENSDLARISKQLATLKRDIDTGLDVTEVVAEPPDRSRLRDVFRDFELRDPLRRLEEALGDGGAAPRPKGVERVEVRRRAGELSSLPAGRAAVAVGRGRTAPALGRDRRRRVLVGEAPDLDSLLRAWGERPLTAHDWKQTSRAVTPALTSEAEGCVAPRVLAHDTSRGLPDQPGPPQVSADELPKRRASRRVDVEEDPDGPCGEAAAVHALAELQRARDRASLACGGCSKRWSCRWSRSSACVERVGVKLDT